MNRDFTKKQNKTIAMTSPKQQPNLKELWEPRAVLTPTVTLRSDCRGTTFPYSRSLKVFKKISKTKLNPEDQARN